MIKVAGGKPTRPPTNRFPPPWDRAATHFEASIEGDTLKLRPSRPLQDKWGEIPLGLLLFFL